MENIQRQFIRW